MSFVNIPFLWKLKHWIDIKDNFVKGDMNLLFENIGQMDTLRNRQLHIQLSSVISRDILQEYDYLVLVSYQTLFR